MRHGLPKKSLTRSKSIPLAPLPGGRGRSLLPRTGAQKASLLIEPTTCPVKRTLCRTCDRHHPADIRQHAMLSNSRYRLRHALRHCNPGVKVVSPISDVTSCEARLALLGMDCAESSDRWPAAVMEGMLSGVGFAVALSGLTVLRTRPRVRNAHSQKPGSLPVQGRGGESDE
jgi:hypothetical protein